MSGKYVTDESAGLLKIATLHHFGISSAVLAQAHREWLTQKVEPLLRSGGSISIIGQASRSGSAKFNEALSEKRANAVRQFLEQQTKMSFPFTIVSVTISVCILTNRMHLTQSIPGGVASGEYDARTSRVHPGLTVAQVSHLFGFPPLEFETLSNGSQVYRWVFAQLDGRTFMRAIEYRGTFKDGKFVKGRGYVLF